MHLLLFALALWYGLTHGPEATSYRVTYRETGRKIIGATYS